MVVWRLSRPSRNLNRFQSKWDQRAERYASFFFGLLSTKKKGKILLSILIISAPIPRFNFFIIKICFFSRRRRLPMLVKRHENDDQHVCIFINSDCCVCVRINRWLLSRGVMRERRKNFEDGTVSAKGSRCPIAWGVFLFTNSTTTAPSPTEYVYTHTCVQVSAPLGHG